MLDIVIMAALAAFILLRLRSELGKKTGNEPLPPAAGRTPYQGAEGQTIEGDAVQVNAGQADVVDLVQDPEVRDGLAKIRQADRHFDVAAFLDGAQSAYGMVLEAFWAGDKTALADFLDPKVLEQFGAAIEQRDAEGLTLSNKLLDITDAFIVGAELKGRTAEITVKFSAEVIAVTKDASGAVVDGNISDVTELSDKWTFARETNAREPNWSLVATVAD
jgi:predicted lipid-binding transport protein (Tim44 family)